jgi:NADPH:quinone reductase
VMALMKKGAYAQFAVALANMTVVLDPDADDVAMASLPAQGTTAFLTLQASTTLLPGESVLVHGAAGGVGSLAVQIAKALGAGTVIGTASTEERRAFVRGLGADFAIAYDEPNWPQTVLEHTNGRGVDVLLESIGGDVFEQNFECLATFGRYIVFGSTRGPGEPFAPRRLMTKAQSLTGIYLPVFFQKPEIIGRALKFLADGVKTGKIKANVATVLPLSQTAEAHRMLEERRAEGVVVLNPRE